MSDHEQETLRLQQQHLSLDDKRALDPEQRCDRCGSPFSQRRRSGGSRQRFCSSECRLDFHRERLRAQRRAPYARRRGLLAYTPAQNETPTGKAAVAELQHLETGVLDIAHCDRVEFVLALKEGETAGTGIETWLGEILAFMSQRVTRWVEEHKDTRIVRAMTIAAPKHNGVRSCMLILHHSPKRDAVPGSDDEALHAAPAGRRAVL